VNFGGFQPLTLTDFPGHVAAIVFAQGCNFRCPFCHNAALLASTAASDATRSQERDIFETLQTRRRVLDGVVVTGGEPTLQPDIATFAARLKGVPLKVKLDTNGSRPAVLRQLLRENLLDYVAMDLKAPFHKYPQLSGVDVCIQDIQESLALLAAGDVPCEFRTTFVPALLTEGDLEEIRSYLPPQATYKVQPFVPDHALDEALRSTAPRICASQGPPPMQPDTRTNDLPHHIDLLSGE